MTRVVKKPETRKNEIVEAARHLFQAQGYEKTSIQDVIASLGIAKGTIYHYFQSKDELLEAVVKDLVESNLAEMEAALNNSKSNALKKFQLLVKAGNVSAEHPELLNHLHEQKNEALHVRLLALSIVKQARLYQKVIGQGCKEGIFETESPLESAEFILSGVQFLTDLGIYRWTQEDLTRRIRAFPRIVERELGASRGSFNFLIKALS